MPRVHKLMRTLLHTMPLVACLIAPVTAGAWEVCDKAQPWYTQGSEGFLYGPTDLSPKTWDLPPELVERLGGTLDILRARGIEVVIVAWPARTLLRADPTLPETERWSQKRARKGYDEFRTAFAPHATVVDVAKALQPLGDSAFFKYDLHLRGAALDAIAGELGPQIKSELPSADFDKRSGPDTEQVGGLGKSVQKTCGITGLVETMPKTVFTTKGVGLLDEAPAAELALVGTSMSNATFDFDGRIAMALHTPVVARAVNNGGAMAPLMSHLQSQEFLAKPSTVIVWEFPWAAFRWGGEGERPEADASGTWSVLDAAAHGPCPATAPTAQAVPIMGTEIELLQTKPLRAPATLHVHFADAPRAPIHVHFGGAESEPVSWSSWRRVAPSNDWFATIPAGTTSVTLELEGGPDTTATAWICER